MGTGGDPGRRFVLLATLSALLVSTLSLAPSPVSAHPPDNPFDDTVFAPIRPGGMRIQLELVADGLTAPLKGTVAPGFPALLFVVDQNGRLWSLDLAAGTKDVVLDVSDRLVTLGVLGPGTFDERGFLGVAFHPDFRTHGRLYTYTSEPTAGPPTFPTTLPEGIAPDHQNVVAEWRVQDPADPTKGVDLPTRRELMRVDWPQFNHDGGDLAFGPDGFLYVSMGDGGGADDQGVGHGPDGNAQRLTVPLGKVHRIDVDGTNSASGEYGIPADNPFAGMGGGVLGEIFAFGFRNPYRFSFDTATGALYVADVGQNDLEELNLVVKGGNYGWNRKEGTQCFDPNGDNPDFAVEGPCDIPGLIDPIAQYDTHHEGHSVIGGFVYRGTQIPQLAGRYVFGEFSRLFSFPFGPDNFGRLLYIQQKKTDTDRLLKIQEFTGFAEAVAALGLGTDPTRQPFPETIAVLGMGQDADGEVYVLGNLSGRPFGTGGVVLRLAPAGHR